LQVLLNGFLIVQGRKQEGLSKPRLVFFRFWSAFFFLRLNFAFYGLLILIYSHAFLASQVLAPTREGKNCSVHISKDSIILVKENMADFVLQTKVRFLYWKFDIFRPLYNQCIISSFMSFTPISSLALFALFAFKQEEDFNPQQER
jgi:hypothetical protein